MNGAGRAGRRGRDRDDRKLLKQEIPVAWDIPHLAAQARLVLRILERPGDAGRASEAAAALHAGHDRAMRLARPGPVACRRGCDPCCRQWVSATAPEIFLVARGIAARGPAALAAARAALAEAAAAVRGRDPAGRLALGRPCPLLHGGACGVYAVRPTACRALASADLAACLRRYIGTEGSGTGGIDTGGAPPDDTVGVPTPEAFPVLRSAYQAALRGALLAAGLPARSYELVSGLHAALETPDAEARWLAGEAVLPDEPRDDGAGPDFDRLVRLLAGECR